MIKHVYVVYDVNREGYRTLARIYERASSAVAWVFEGEGPNGYPDQLLALEDLVVNGELDMAHVLVKREEVL